MYTGNLLIDYWDRLPAVVAAVAPTPAWPGYQLPPLDDGLTALFAPATAAWVPAGEYRGRRLTRLDLSGNPGTQTTKTFASLLMVARAVDHIRRTGESIMIVTPTSANKGVALRDAVGRAVTLGLVDADQLRVLVVCPAASRSKLRAAPLREDLNPLLVYAGDPPESVKALARAFVTEHAEALWRDRKLRLWYTLDIANYLVADAARAFFEQDADPLAGPRTHAHAVSSAYGLLGYHAGRDVAGGPHPASLLVQHLATPDLVVAVGHPVPGYTPRAAGGFARCGHDPHYPPVVDDPVESIDATLYTRAPVTAPAITAVIRRYGGDGIVVSRAECLTRHADLRRRFPLPADPSELREWSTVMAFTGVLEAIDRDLVAPGADIVVHGTGTYTSADLTPVAVTEVRTTADIAARLDPPG